MRERYMFNFNMVSGLNLCVVGVENGGEVFIEEMGDSSFCGMFDESVYKGVGECVEVGEGLEVCEKYYGVRGEENMLEWEGLKREYIERIKNKKGKCVVWIVGKDCELMFIEE